ncbi:unnamed protein product [Penicillium salamii]|nr:unnamed protein product [Penicillium salamii]
MRYKSINSNLWVVQLSKLSSLTAEFMKLLHYNNVLIILSLKLLNLYLCFWECYVIKSAEKI